MAQQNLDVILNRDVIAVDQDALGVQAFTVANVNDQWTLMRPLADGDTAVAFFNNASGDWAVPTGAFADLGLDPAKAYLAKDLWTKTVSKVTDPLTSAFIPSHATVMLRLSDRAPTVTVPAHVSAASTGPNGIAVTYDASAVDAFGDPLTTVCSTPSGSVFPIGPTLVTCSATDAAGRAGSASFIIDVAPPEHPLPVGGTVPASLTLALGGPVSFGAFTPGVAKVYEASTTATVTSTAGDATLSVSDSGHLANGTYTLPQPLQVTGVPRVYGAPVSNDAFSIGFKQPIGANDPLRTGTYSTTLTFTLSTTTP
jgi:X-Pro dipeptidyl-peptidase